MLRLRRYRYYVLSATIIIFLLFHVAQNSGQWDSVSASVPYSKTPPGHRTDTSNRFDPSFKGDTRFYSNGNDDLPQKILDDTADDHTTVTIPDLKAAGGVDDDDDDLPTTIIDNVDTTQVVAYDKDGAAKTTLAPLIDIPDQNVGQGAKGAAIAKEKETEVATTTTIHWRKMPEHFPLAESEIISLPTGKPYPIPSVQYDFGKESPAAREKRQGRQDLVKAEMERSWAGYMKYAKGHDELSPVSGKFRDPFCGWAATLVDSLDTLWIMDMKDEFEEALLEVEKIDFTTSSTRSEIPVFETTIRYLGGLVAAYDVTGGKTGGYDILLEKAIELAEILMGVFDTPNRMPILYYNWKPAFASQPKRAGSGVSVAELGSLAMEFTRLAQITKESRYYDAVARITDAFFEWQERGTSLSGIFPEHVDAAGCNRTAEAEIAAQQSKLSIEEEEDLYADDEGYSPATSNEKVKQSSTKSGKRSTSANKGPIQQTNHLSSKEKPLPDCIAKGLDSAGWGSEQYSMGGSQDSTYEYFPKQFLLLGGLEPKYKWLHMNMTKAVKKWLLYRPMVPDDRDILFSAKVMTQGNPEFDANTEFEVSHLTCFIGGMFGLGGKIFDVPADVEIGKKLTDGCVWAYESTPSGIMPEGAHVVPCTDPANCHWNQTMYEEWLDPLFDTREASIKDYNERKAELKEQKERERQDALLQKFAEDRALKADPDATGDKTEQLRKAALADDAQSHPASYSVPKKWEDVVRSDVSGNQRRAPTSKFTESEEESSMASKSSPADSRTVEADSDPAPGFSSKGISQIPLQEEVDPDPLRPLSHEEYVANKIKNEKLPPGFVNVNFRRYILRPEAIESVWYMHRITGESYWQEKGWKMFRAIVSQTTTEAGNSAIDDVLIKNSEQVNEMESFWTAETLKYFYLLYSEPDLISLDEWVLNTEAHPFKRPTAPFNT
ncbi:glycoside hydrolase family 47 protein [Xylariaceae sp. FL0016]|nr:glycoside hydrolase family 47 protein [Xylariaceae sp. FL0016]